MNKLIKELSEQSGLLGPRSRIVDAHEAAERFLKGDLNWVAAMQESAMVVNKHFGISND